MKRSAENKFLALNQVHLGDCTQLLKHIEPNSLALSVWSPPYWVGKEYEADLTFQNWKDLLRETISLHYAILKPGSFLAINIADILCFKDEEMPRIQLPNVSKQRSPVTRDMVLAAKAKYPDYNRNQIAEVLGCSEQTVDRRLNGNNIRGGKYQTQTRVKLVGGFIEEWGLSAGLFLYDRRIWAKDPAWVNSQWHSSSYRAVDEVEYVYIFWKPGETVIDRNRIDRDEWAKWGSRGIWNIPSVRSNEQHEAQFPIELPKRLIRLLTEKDDIVLDCFMGSGTSALAAIDTGRNFIGIEKLPQYQLLATNAISRHRVWNCENYLAYAKTFRTQVIHKQLERGLDMPELQMVTPEYLKSKVDTDERVGRFFTYGLSTYYLEVQLEWDGCEDEGKTPYAVLWKIVDKDTVEFCKNNVIKQILTTKLLWSLYRKSK